MTEHNNGDDDRRSPYDSPLSTRIKTSTRRRLEHAVAELDKQQVGTVTISSVLDQIINDWLTARGF